MRKAQVGEINDFSNVKIEVRDFSDPIIQAGLWTDYSYNFGYGWKYLAFLFNLCLLGAVIVLCYVAYDIYNTKKKFKGIPALGLVQEEDSKNNNQGLEL